LEVIERKAPSKDVAESGHPLHAAVALKKKKARITGLFGGE
jgi:hypothetical protein